MKKLIYMLMILGIFLAFSGCAEKEDVVEVNTEDEGGKIIGICIECDENLLFNKYDLHVYIDNVYIEDVQHGESRKLIFRASVGEHDLKIESVKDSSISATAKISVNEVETGIVYVRCTSSSLVLRLENLENMTTNQEDHEKSESLKQETEETLKENDSENESISNTGGQQNIDNNVNDEQSSTDIVQPILAEDEVQMPMSDYYYTGKDFTIIVKQLEELGFNNITTQVVKDIVTGFLVKDGEVEEVIINGNNNFEENEIFKKDAEVIVVYHTYTDAAREALEEKERIKSNKNNKETITPENSADLRNLFNAGSLYYSEEDWEDFVDKNKWRLLEFDAIMNYTRSTDEGDTVITVCFYPEYAGRIFYRPYFVEPDANTNRNGLEDYSFTERHGEAGPVHVKCRVKSFDGDFMHCIIEIEEVTPRV